MLTQWSSLEAQTVKNLPAMQDTWVQPLGWEDPLEKEMATLSSILAWRIPWMLIIIQLIFIIHRFYICTFAAK